MNNSMRFLCVVQARMQSTRLPRKVMLDICGHNVLEWVVLRASASKLISGLVVATGVSSQNLPIVKYCAKNNIDVFCGDDEDLLDRFYQVASLYQADNIVRITADCPLIDPAVIDSVINEHIRSRADYTSNIDPSTFAEGEDIAVFSFKALRKAWENASLKSEREHVIPYLFNNPGIFRISNVKSPVDVSHKRWTLDYPQDYRFLTAVFDKLAANPLFTRKDVLNLIEKYPELEKINSNIRRREGYLKSLANDLKT